MRNGALAMFTHQGRFSLELRDDFPGLVPHFGGFGAGFPAELESCRMSLDSLDHVWRVEGTWINARQNSIASELLRSTW